MLCAVKEMQIKILKNISAADFFTFRCNTFYEYRDVYAFYPRCLHRLVIWTCFRYIQDRNRRTGKKVRRKQGQDSLERLPAKMQTNGSASGRLRKTPPPS